VLKELLLLLKVCDIFSLSAALDVVESEVLIKLGFVDEMSVAAEGGVGKALR